MTRLLRQTEEGKEIVEKIYKNSIFPKFFFISQSHPVNLIKKNFGSFFSIKKVLNCYHAISAE